MVCRNQLNSVFAAISVLRIFTLELYLKRRIQREKAIVARVDFMAEIAIACIESVIDETSTFVGHFPLEGLKMEFRHSFGDQLVLTWLRSKNLTCL